MAGAAFSVTDPSHDFQEIYGLTVKRTIIVLCGDAEDAQHGWVKALERPVESYTISGALCRLFSSSGGLAMCDCRVV